MRALLPEIHKAAGVILRDRLRASIWNAQYNAHQWRTVRRYSLDGLLKEMIQGRLHTQVVNELRDPVLAELVNHEIFGTED